MRSFDYRDDFRGPGDGCRVCTGKLEIDEDGDLVCYYCNTIESKNFNYYNWKLAKLTQQRNDEIKLQPKAKIKNQSFLLKIKNFFGF